MSETEKALKRGFRMEMLGTGLYRGLAVQYGLREPELAARFLRFGADEYKHGRLFGKVFFRRRGRPLRGGGLWILMGRALALGLRPVSLETKLKKLSRIEAAAVNRLERELALCGDPELRRVMFRILPDEVRHAALYGELFPVASA